MSSKLLEVIDNQERLVLGIVSSDAFASLVSSGFSLGLYELMPSSILTTSSYSISSVMRESYQKGVSDNIEEGFGAAVSDQVSDAAISEHLAVVNNYTTTTYNEVLYSLLSIISMSDQDGDIDVSAKVYLAYLAVKSIFNILRTKKRTLILDAGVIGPYNQGLFDSVNSKSLETGREYRKQWVSLGDEKVRTSHRLLDGDIVPVSSPFNVNGVPIRFPRDPLAPPELTIRCRCVLKFTN